MSQEVTLTLLQEHDREQFILDNQYAFKYGALVEFGKRDDHFEEGEEIISRKTIEDSIDQGVAYRIRLDGRVVGGMVLTIDPASHHNHLDLLFVSPDVQGHGVGTRAWQLAERLYPDTEVWETCTPYFEKRNIHFYINKCGFAAVEYFNRFHPDPHDPETGKPNNYAQDDGFDGMFRFEKRMK